MSERRPSHRQLRISDGSSCGRATAAAAVVGWTPGLWTPARAAAARRIAVAGCGPGRHHPRVDHRPDGRPGDGLSNAHCRAGVAGGGARRTRHAPDRPRGPPAGTGHHRPPHRHPRRRRPVAGAGRVHRPLRRRPVRLAPHGRRLPGPRDADDPGGGIDGRAHQPGRRRGPITGRVDRLRGQHRRQHRQLPAQRAASGTSLCSTAAAVTPNSGDPASYEGVAADAPRRRRPLLAPGSGRRLPDNYKTVGGFPSVAGLLERRSPRSRAPGLGSPGTRATATTTASSRATRPTNAACSTPSPPGRVKVAGLDDPAGDHQPAHQRPGSARHRRRPRLARVAVMAVTPDPARRFVTSGRVGRRPTSTRVDRRPTATATPPDAVGSRVLYYTFAIGDGVLGICLDTVNRGGYAEGSIGGAQLDWLEQRARRGPRPPPRRRRAARSTTTNGDQLVVLFSHHNLFTLENPFPDPAMPARSGCTGDEIRALLHRFPNVVAWVNGHSHINRVTPVPRPAGRPADSGRSPRPRTSTTPSRPASSRSSTTPTARCRSSARSSSTPRRRRRGDGLDGWRWPVGAASCPSTRSRATPRWAWDHHGPQRRAGAPPPVLHRIGRDTDVDPDLSSDGTPRLADDLPATGGRLDDALLVGGTLAAAALALRTRRQGSTDAASARPRRATRGDEGPEGDRVTRRRASRSPVRMRTRPSRSVTQILPSPILPVWAAAAMASMTADLVAGRRPRSRSSPWARTRPCTRRPGRPRCGRPGGRSPGPR